MTIRHNLVLFWIYHEANKNGSRWSFIQKERVLRAVQAFRLREIWFILWSHKSFGRSQSSKHPFRCHLLINDSKGKAFNHKQTSIKMLQKKPPFKQNSCTCSFQPLFFQNVNTVGFLSEWIKRMLATFCKTIDLIGPQRHLGPIKRNQVQIFLAVVWRTYSWSDKTSVSWQGFNPYFYLYFRTEEWV